MIEISTSIKAPLSTVWNEYTSVEAVQYWSFASDDWAADGIENDVRVGGTLKSRNFAKDGSAEFIFSGTYTEVFPQKLLAYTLDDGRHVIVNFQEVGDQVKIDLQFDPESENPEQMQKEGWQAYLDNFKKYIEQL